jgi:hypothetical protein
VNELEIVVGEEKVSEKDNAGEEQEEERESEEGILQEEERQQDLELLRE